jgi:tripartite-type tricarboxylate transporter receptor subunit TctC
MKPEVVNKALTVAIAQPAVSANYNESAYTSESSSPSELTGDVKQAFEAWGQLVKAADIQKQ